ncbi:MAG TPA: hypothetical protein VFI73_04320 [Candidatus Nitrosopolaris sp.]|nr:hypothetical protein [Candidatus Nitrosopolaris sp.]
MVQRINFREIMIIQQCDRCIEKGKNAYCDRCVKSSDYYDLYRYSEGQENRFMKGKMIGTIKAYTWHDAIQHIKDNFFHNCGENLNVNCEKDFAYLEAKPESIVSDNKSTKNPLGYTIYLNNEGNVSGSLSSLKENFWDLTASNKYQTEQQ